MSAWKRYKESLGNARPWDILNPGTEYVNEQESTDRYAICEECPELIGATKQCRKCGCFMKIKVKLKNAECPIGKW